MQALTTLRRSLAQSPDPDSSLNYLERFLKHAEQEGEPSLLHGHRLPIVTAVFGNSHFLAETLFRYPELLDWALDENRLYRLLSTDELRSELGWLPPDITDDEAAKTLARFKRMHLLRIVIRDLLRFATLADVTEELSNLADAILQGAQEHIQQQLVRRFGRPLTQADSGPIESHFVVLALGKLGGRELNYSSDIDLMYLYTAEAKTSGPVPIPGREFFAQLAQRLTRTLSQITPEGSCFRVDLRLRPEGGSGEMAIPLGSAMKYYHTRARDWELQMLIKARAVAGNRPLGATFLAMVEPLIYQTTTDFSMIEGVAKTRDRIQMNLSGHRDNGLNVKLSRGGIRDIEFLVQCLQRLYGGREPWVRGGGTLLSLHRLRDKGYLSAQDYARLYAAYSYLRTLEHHLQIEHNRQVHSIPSQPEPRQILTRKMYGKSPRKPTAWARKSNDTCAKSAKSTSESSAANARPSLRGSLSSMSKTPRPANRPPTQAGRPSFNTSNSNPPGWRKPSPTCPFAGVESISNTSSITSSPFPACSRPSSSTPT